MNHVDELLKIQNNCAETVESLVKNKESLINILNQTKSNTDDDKIHNSVNDLSSKIERMINLAGEGKLDDLNKLRDEITLKYGRNNKQ